MTALTANRNVDRLVDQDIRSFPVGAAVHIYGNGYVGVDPAGYTKAFVPGDLLAGIAYEEIDNSSGAAAAKNVRVFTQGDFVLALSGAALTDIGKPVFATDDATLSLSGHPDAFVGTIVQYYAAGYVVVRLKQPGEKPPNGLGSTELVIKGTESIDPTGADGATHGNIYIGGFEGKSILGLGIYGEDAENGGVSMEVDAVAEIALGSIRLINDILPVDKGATLDVDLVLSDKGDDAALDVSIGFGTALTANSEANIDHADMVQLAAFHLNGASDNILCQSDDGTTDVAETDSLIDNDSATDVPKHLKIIVRPTGVVEYWIAGARVLATTAFAVLSTALIAAHINLEKTANDTTAKLTFWNLRVAGACKAA